MNDEQINKLGSELTDELLEVFYTHHKINVESGITPPSSYSLAFAAITHMLVKIIHEASFDPKQQAKLKDNIIHNLNILT